MRLHQALKMLRRGEFPSKQQAHLLAQGQEGFETDEGTLQCHSAQSDILEVIKPLHVRGAVQVMEQGDDQQQCRHQHCTQHDKQQ